MGVVQLTSPVTVSALTLSLFFEKVASTEPVTISLDLFSPHFPLLLLIGQVTVSLSLAESIQISVPASNGVLDLETW